MSIRCNTVCVDGAFTLVENLQSHEENEKSLYLLAWFLSLVFFFFFLSSEYYTGLNHFFLKSSGLYYYQKRHCALCYSYWKSNNSNKLMGGPCWTSESPEAPQNCPSDQERKQLPWLAARWFLAKISSLEIAHMCIIHVWNSFLQFGKP